MRSGLLWCLALGALALSHSVTPPQWEAVPLLERDAAAEVAVLALRKLSAETNQAMEFLSLISAARQPSGTVGRRSAGSGPGCYFLTMDCSIDGSPFVLSLEACKEGNTIDYSLPTPLKSRKANTHELFSSLTDEWIKVPPTDPLAVEATAQMFNALPEPPGYTYTGHQIIYAEMRTRELSVESNYLIKEKQTTDEEIIKLSADIVKLNQQLVEKLAFKKTALETDGGSTVNIDTVDKDINKLQSDLKTAEARQVLKQDTSQRLLDSSIEVAKELADQQIQEATGKANANDRKYVLSIIRITRDDPTGVESTEQKYVLGYKTPASGKKWKTIATDDFKPWATPR